MKATVPVFETPYVLSTHAELRVLERTNLSGGQLLHRLNTRACVWLPRRGAEGEWYALVHCMGSQTYVVCVIAGALPVLKTVLTLQMWENDYGTLPFIWLALARIALVQSIAGSEAPPASPAAPAQKDKPAYWVDFSLELAPEVDIDADNGAAQACAPVLLALGRLTRDELVSFGMEPPRSITRPTWKNTFDSQLRRLMKKPDLHGWLLTHLAEHQTVVERATRLLAGFGAGDRAAARTLDMTDVLVDALTAEPPTVALSPCESEVCATADLLEIHRASSAPVERLVSTSELEELAGLPSPELRRTQKELQTLGIG